MKKKSEKEEEGEGEKPIKRDPFISTHCARGWASCTKSRSLPRQSRVIYFSSILSMTSATVWTTERKTRMRPCAIEKSEEERQEKPQRGKKEMGGDGLGGGGGQRKDSSKPMLTDFKSCSSTKGRRVTPTTEGV